MRIVFLGSAGFGIASLEAINASDNELSAIFTQPAQPAGRQRKPRPTPVANWACDNSITCTETENVNSPDMIEKIAACCGDLLVVIAFGQKISQRLIDLHPKRAINVHASLLPKYRGAAPINRAVINGESETGISIITLAERMDAGEILAQGRISIAPDDTARTVHDKLAQTAAPLLIKTIEKIAAGTAVYTEQDESLVTFAGKLSKSDGIIDWSASADSIVNKIRGLWSWPGAQAVFLSSKTGKSCRVTIAEACVAEGSSKQLSGFGTIDENLNVLCGSGTLRILQLKPAGGRLMDFQAFANGRAVSTDDMFISINESE